jgi:hypothetical protein
MGTVVKFQQINLKCKTFISTRRKFLRLIFMCPTAKALLSFGCVALFSSNNSAEQNSERTRE